MPSIPRLAIVVPVGSNDSAFEETLSSVLANQPAGSEVIVAHDGSYSDPFDLAGEVRFVAGGPSPIEMIRLAAVSTRARFVHVLTPGFQAIEDWTEPALAMFEEYDVAAVAPVIRNSKGEIEAAGWHDTPIRLGQPVAAGQRSVDDKTASKLVGAYLNASFWRRDVLRSLPDAFESNRICESGYAYGHLIAKVGWRTVLAIESSVVATEKAAQWAPSTFNRGRNLRAIRKAITRKERKMSMAFSLMRGIVQPKSIPETIGLISYRGKMASTKRRLQIDQVASCDEESVLTMPSRGEAPLRRAA